MRQSRNRAEVANILPAANFISESEKRKESIIMNKTQLVEAVAAEANLSKKDAEAAVKATFAAIEGALVKGDKVQLIGFGTFETRVRGERTGKNPRTGETVKIAGRLVAVYYPLVHVIFFSGFNSLRISSKLIFLYKIAFNRFS